MWCFVEVPCNTWTFVVWQPVKCISTFVLFGATICKLIYMQQLSWHLLLYLLYCYFLKFIHGSVVFGVILCYTYDWMLYCNRFSFILLFINCMRGMNTDFPLIKITTLDFILEVAHVVLRKSMDRIASDSGRLDIHSFICSCCHSAVKQMLCQIWYIVQILFEKIF